MRDLAFRKNPASRDKFIAALTQHRKVKIEAV
jgi:hypothetical protein